MNFLKCVSYLARLGAFSFLLGRLLVMCDKFRKLRFERFLIDFVDEEKENGFFKFIRVHKWQKKVPDMSRILPKLIPAKAINKGYKATLPRMIEETYIAEIVHIALMFFGFNCCRIWEGAGGIIISFLFALGNVPFVIIQRYNRPRLIRLYRRVNKVQSIKQGENQSENNDIELQHGTRT